MGFMSNALRGEALRAGRNDHGVIVTLAIVIGAFRFVARFCSGRPLLGPAHRSTDSSFRARATRKLRPNDREPGPWAYLPEYQRALVRLGVLLLLVAAGWWWAAGSLFGSAAHDLVSFAAGALVAAAVWSSVVRVDAKVRQARHERRLTAPLRAAVAPILGVATRDVNIHLPRRTMTGGAQDTEES